ncbi:MAG TPA: DUF1232 domain-containing protein [Syntrophomonadaceae bacterium]|nr:DUF1232 domain-containing protein [Syntrophomonadaceae bacterium]HQE22898.1 DUF1232 domain-containing protein [Syntrophomonadaceae bacterium]
MEYDYDQELGNMGSDRSKSTGQLAEKVLQEALLLIPNFLKLLYRLLKDQSVSTADKALLAATVAYVLSPLDFIPDMVPFLGQVDDMLLVALVLKRLMDSVSHDVLEQYWDGDERLLIWIEKIISLSRYVVPPPIYNRLVKKARA